MAPSGGQAQNCARRPLPAQAGPGGGGKCPHLSAGTFRSIWQLQGQGPQTNGTSRGLGEEGAIRWLEAWGLGFPPGQGWGGLCTGAEVCCGGHRSPRRDGGLPGAPEALLVPELPWPGAPAWGPHGPVFTDTRLPASPPPPHSPPEPRTWPDTAVLMKAALHVTAAVEGGGRGGVAVNPGSGGGTQAGGRGGAGRGWGCREVQGPEHAGAQSQRGERPAGTERRQPSVPLTLCPWRGPGFPGAGSPWTSQPTGAPRRPGPRLASSTRPSLPPAQLPPRLRGLATWPVTPPFPLERVHPQSARPGPCTPHTPSEGPTLPLCPVSPAMSSERMLGPQGRAWGAGHFAGHPGGAKIA